jgi:hypothetical protein
MAGSPETNRARGRIERIGLRPDRADGLTLRKRQDEVVPDEILRRNELAAFSACLVSSPGLSQVEMQLLDERLIILARIRDEDV